MYSIHSTTPHQTYLCNIVREDEEEEVEKKQQPRSDQVEDMKDIVNDTANNIAQ